MLVLLITALFVASTQLPSRAAGPSVPELLRVEHPDLRPNQQRLVELDKKVILELVAFARYNIHFHEETNRHWVWRTWLYPIAQEAGTAASFANTLIDLRERAHGLKSTDLISTAMQKRGLKSAITGNAISGSASALELAQNVMIVSIAGRQGYSPKQSVNFVKQRLQTIDALLSEREQVVGITRPGQIHQMHELEGHLLQHVRDELLLEFKRWSTHSRETMWRENTFYTIDSAQNFTSMTAGIISRNAFGLPSLKGTAAIGALVANTMTALNPPLKMAVGVGMRKYQRWYLERVLPNKRRELTTEILSNWDLKQLAASSDDGSSDKLHIQEAVFLADNAKFAEGALSHEQKQIEKLRQVAVQQSVSGPIIGTASVARSLLATIAYYEYRGDAVTGNKLALAGRISQTAGQTYSLINTPLTRINQSIYTHKLKSRGELPSQVLAARLKQLDDLQHQIESTQKPAATPEGRSREN